jgi:hypothetical protein
MLSHGGHMARARLSAKQILSQVSHTPASVGVCQRSCEVCTLTASQPPGSGSPLLEVVHVRCSFVVFSSRRAAAARPLLVRLARAAWRGPQPPSRTGNARCQGHGALRGADVRESGQITALGYRNCQAIGRRQRPSWERPSACSARWRPASRGQRSGRAVRRRGDDADGRDLGDAATYAVISGASVGNTVSAAGAPHITLRGDLGVKANTQPTDVPPSPARRSPRPPSTARGVVRACRSSGRSSRAARAVGAVRRSPCPRAVAVQRSTRWTRRPTRSPSTLPRCVRRRDGRCRTPSLVARGRGRQS